MKKFQAIGSWTVFLLAMLVTIGLSNGAYALDLWACRTGPTRVIRIGDRFSEVQLKCGKPDAIYEETTRDGVVKAEWIYEKKDLYLGFYNVILTFEEGKLVSIEKE